MKRIESIPYFFLLAKSWQFAGSGRGTFVLVYLGSVIAYALVALVPAVFGWFIDVARSAPDVMPKAWLYTALYVGLYVLFWCLHGPSRIAEQRLAFNISKAYLDDLFSKFVQIDINWYRQTHSGSTINRLRKGYLALRGFFENGFEFLKTIIQFILSFAAMIYFSPLFGTIAIGIGGLTIWIIFNFDRRYIDSIKKLNETEHSFFSHLTDGVSNILSIVSLRVEKDFRNALLESFGRMSPHYLRSAVVGEWKWFVANMMVALMYCVTLLGFVYQNSISGQSFPVGDLVALVGFVTQFTSVFYNIASQYTTLLKFRADFDAPLPILTAYESGCRPEYKDALPPDWKLIEISKLNFGYDGESRGLDFSTMNNSGDFRLEIRRGQKIAIVGESGGGKSTFFFLLRNLHEPGTGTCAVVDGQSFNWSAIGNSAVLMPQESEIFDNTILYNLTLGLCFTDDDVRRACYVANFDTVLAQLPGELSFKVSENGSNFSGGERQRLLLARGLLAASHASILLLDEPISAVDPAIATSIILRLFSEFRDKTIICTLHNHEFLPMFDTCYELNRKSLIRRADNVVGI